MKPITYFFMLSLMVSTNLHAAVISRDWKTPGDGLLTYDTVNKREWLDVPESLLYYHGSFELVVAKTVTGGEFEGFIPAKLADVVALAESSGIDTATTVFSTNHSATLSFTSLVGITSGTNSVLGVLDELDPAPLNAATPRLIASIGASEPQNFAGLFVFSDTSGFDAPGIVRVAGVWLYREIPEPWSLSACFPAICLLGIRLSRGDIVSAGCLRVQ